MFVCAHASIIYIYMCMHCYACIHQIHMCLHQVDVHIYNAYIGENVHDINAENNK